MRVHDSQAYREMDVTREGISCTLDLREILLSFQTGFLVNAARSTKPFKRFLAGCALFALRALCWAVKRVRRCCNDVKEML